MIIIDGKELTVDLKEFQNLEELLSQLTKEPELNDRVVTDVFLNESPFSELYPHQSEDIDCSTIQKLEIRSTLVDDMAMDIVGELNKVITLMSAGAKEVANLFRQNNESEALEMFQDLIDVTRDFMGMVSILHDSYTEESKAEFDENVKSFSVLMEEMLDVLSNDDFLLLSDLLEYEFLPACKEWEHDMINLKEVVKK